MDAQSAGVFLPFLRLFPFSRLTLAASPVGYSRIGCVVPSCVALKSYTAFSSVGAGLRQWADIST